MANRLPTVLLFTAAAALSGCFSRSVQRLKIPRDRLFLKNGEITTGKTLNIDSADLRLRRPDHSVILLPKNFVDSIAGLSYRTRFVSVSAVGGEVNYWSRFFYENRSASGAGYQVRVGRLVMGRRCRYFQYTRLGLEPFWLKKYSLGWSCYFWKPYFAKSNAFAGVRWDVNKLYKNGWPYSSFALTAGGEYFLKEKIRFFGEADWMKNLSSAQPKPSFTVAIGLRFGLREHSVFYKKLNAQLK